MIIDASALRLLAAHPQIDDNWVLTPHPGEAARVYYRAQELKYRKIDINPLLQYNISTEGWWY